MTEQELKAGKDKHDTLRAELNKLYAVDYASTLKDLYTVKQTQSVQNSIDAFKKISELSKPNADYLNTITQAGKDLNLHKHIFEATSNPELIGNSLIMGVDIGKEKKAYDNISSIMGADVLSSALTAESSKPWNLDIGEHAKPKYTFEVASNLESMNKAWLSSLAVSQPKSATDYLLPIKEAEKAFSQDTQLNNFAEMVKNSASHNIKHEVTAAEIAAKEWGELAKTDYLKQFGADDYTTTQLQSVQNSINAFKKATESVGGYNKILELAKNSAAPFSYAEEAIKNLNQHKHIFEAAGNLESINRALLSSPAMAQLKSATDYLSKIKEAEEALSQGAQQLHPKTYMPGTFEMPKIPENPTHVTNKKLDNLIESQNGVLEILCKQLESQNGVLESMERLSNLQKSNFEVQLKQSDKQHNERIEQQQRQIENSEKDSKKAIWIARVSIIVSIVVSILSVVASICIYNLQDESDEKNHREINQALNKIADSVINSNTQQSKNNDKLIEAIKKQKGKNER